MVPGVLRQVIPCDFRHTYSIDSGYFCNVRINRMELQKFCIAGINYKKADAELRSLFAINDDQYISILNNAQSFGLKEVFVLSTCNRTEIYGLTDNANDLINLLCLETQGDVQAF